MTKTMEKPRPPKQPTDEQADAFVAGGTGNDSKETQKNMNTEKRVSVKMARLTVDLPDDEHLAFKLACTRVRTKMNEEIRQFITRRTAELEQAAG